jgi:hypothetical protein
MLHRLLFVAGMTVGVTTPLVWAAYVARPAPRATPTPAVTLAKATPKAEKPAHAAAKDVTASIPPASAATRATPKTAKVTQAKPSAPAQTNAPAHNKPTRSHLKPAHVAQPPRAEPRYRPAVVDSYNGAHIITVCAVLTENEQLRAGCP